jgi:predicted GNAT superfamily acetyltransferase
MTPSSARPSPVLTAAPAIELRALKSHADYAACVQLQRETWGADYTDCVPASVLKVSQLVGGVSGGAFTADGRLVGFVYGLTGVRDGRLIHWSHMLAVTPDFRNHGVGRRLKEYQREALRTQGIEMIYWTFDPLVARNAHLNLNRLGTVVEEYVPDMYGETGSELHAFGTDRFVVSWAVSKAGRGVPSAVAGWRATQVVNGGAPARVVELSGDGARASGAHSVRIEVPADVESMPVREARAWREATRPSFVRLLGDGYRVKGFVSDAEEGCFYVLTRDAAATAT